MAGPEGVNARASVALPPALDVAEDVNARVSVAPQPPPDSNSAGEDGSDATISQPVTDVNKHEITSATPQDLSSALQHDSPSTTPRSGPEEGQGDEHLAEDVDMPPTDSDDGDPDAAAAAAGGEKGLRESIHNFFAELAEHLFKTCLMSVTRILKAAVHGPKEETVSEAEITTRGVSESDLPELKKQRNPKNSYSVNNATKGK